MTYEGQAAIELEAACDPAEHGAYPMDGLDPREAILAAVRPSWRWGSPVGVVAARVHDGLAAAVAAACARAAEDAGTDLVVLAGACSRTGGCSAPRRPGWSAPACAC